MNRTSHDDSEREPQNSDRENPTDFEIEISTAREQLEKCRSKCDMEGTAFFLQKLGWLYFDSNPQEAIKNLYAALELYEQLKDPGALADTYNMLGQLEPDTAKALKMLDQQLSVLQKIGANRFLLSWHYECKARRYELEGDIANALVAYSAILEIFEKDESPVSFKEYCSDPEDDGIFENKSQIACIQHRIAVIHGKMGKYDLALELFNMTLEVCAENGDFIRSGCSSCHVYQDMGDMEMSRKCNTKAQEYYKNALETASMNPDFELDDELRERIEKARQMMADGE